MNPMEVISGGQSSVSNKDVTLVPIDSIYPDESQARKSHDESSLLELSQTIRDLGVIQPIIVRPADDSGRHKIIAGERRYLASRKAGLSEVPVRVIDADDDKVLLMQAVENLSREDLKPLEEASCVLSLVEQVGSQSEVSQSIGKTLQWVGSRLKVAKSADRLVELGFHEKCSSINALAMLVPLLDNEKAVAMLSGLDEVKISDIKRVRDALAVKNEQKSRKKPEVKFSVDQFKPKLTELSKNTGFRIKLKPGAGGANLTIGVSSKRDLERVVDLLENLGGE